MSIYKYLILILITLCPFLLKAQIGYGTNSPDQSSIVELSSATKGLLIPRISLTRTNSLSPVVAPANSLLVVNTATVGLSPYNVTPGFYFFNEAYNSWIGLGEETNDAWKLSGNAGTNSSTNFVGTINLQDIVFKRDNVWAGSLNMSSHNSVSFGFRALNSLNTASGNIAIGYETLTQNINADYGVGFGSQVLSNNANGSQNIGFGYKSLNKNVSGVFNVGLGSYSLYNNITSSNLGIGTESLYNNRDGEHNYAFGRKALIENTSGGINIAIGSSALNKNTTDGQNIAIGYEALYNSNALGNVAIGKASLRANLSGQYNTSIGANSMLNNTYGVYNTSVGAESLKRNISGSFNTAFGYLAGQNLDNSGNGNIAFGTNTNLASATGNNQLNIANNIFGTGLSGNISSLAIDAKIGISTAHPTSTLHVEGSLSSSIKVLTSGTITDTDYTILVGGNITMPAAATYTGRIYNLINNDGGTYTITGSFRQNTTVSTSYVLSNVDGTKGVVVQSTGTNWMILEKN